MSTPVTIVRARLEPGALPRAVHSIEPPLDAAIDPAVHYGAAAEDLVAVPDALVGKVGQGWTWDGAAFAAPPALTIAEIAAIKDGFKANVDAEAEALRLTLITPGSGQAMEYQEAFNEAVQVSNALAANPGTAMDPAKFPMLAASIGFDRDPTTGKATADVAGEARAVLAAYDAYQRAGAAIRGARLKGKAAIDAANTVEAAAAAYAAIVWPKFG